MKASQDTHRLTANDSNPFLVSRLSQHMGITSLKDRCISTFHHVAIYCASNSALNEEGEDVCLSPIGASVGFVYFHIWMMSTVPLYSLLLCNLKQETKIDR